MNYSQDQFRQMIDEIPTLAWSCLLDGSSDHCADGGQAVEPDRIPGDNNQECLIPIRQSN